MKSRIFFLISTIFLILILFQTPTINALEYNVGVNERDEFIWKCNICDSQKMEEILGTGWDANGTGIFQNLKQESQMKWIITEFNNNAELYSEKTNDFEGALSIKFYVWTWTDDTNWGDSDYEDRLILFLNPSHNKVNTIYFNFVPFWLPVPIGEYMKELEPYLYEGYTVDGRVLLAITFEVDKGDLNGETPNEYIKVLAMYNERGILRSYKLYVLNHQVIVDISLVSNPIFELPIVISILVISYIGLIYVMRKIE